MANWATSVLQTGTALFNEDFIAKGEWRNEDAAALMLAMKSSMSSPELASIRTAESRTVKAYMPVRGADGSGTGRAISHTGGIGASKAVTPSWNTLSETFQISKKRADNNEYNAAQIFKYELKSRVLSLIKRSAAAYNTLLVADKSGVNAGGANGAFNGSADVYEVEKASADYYFDEIDAMMMQNRYDGMVDIVCDAKAFARARRLANQGSGNATNTSFQFGNKNIVGTTATLLSGYDGSSIVYPSGTVGFIPWIPTLNRKDINAMQIENGVGDFGNIAIPELGINVALHAYSKQANTSETGGAAQDAVTEFELSIDWAYVSSPLSTAEATIVNAVGLIL